MDVFIVVKRDFNETEIIEVFFDGKIAKEFAAREESVADIDEKFAYAIYYEVIEKKVS